MKEFFYRIVMIAKNGKKLYLCEKPDKNPKIMLCQWEFNTANCLWFESEKGAKEFAQDYFKNFDRYIIEEFEYAI